MITAHDAVAETIDEYLFRFHGVTSSLNQADAFMEWLGERGYEVTKKSDPMLDLRDDNGNYLGKRGTTHEHRTVGNYRAWSYEAHEWCYPSDPCRLCKEMA